MKALKGIFGIALLFVVVMTIHKVTNRVVKHFDYIDDIETTNSVLTESNGILQDNNDVLQTAIIESEEGKTELLEEIKRLHKENEDDKREFTEQQKEFEKQNLEQQQEIVELVEQMHKAGLRNIPVPDGVIRMQRDKAKAVNARAGSYKQEKAGDTEEKAD
jgi:hypothetical protein